MKSKRSIDGHKELRKAAGGVHRVREPARRRRPPVRPFVELALAGDYDHTTALALDYLLETRSRIAVITDLFDAAQAHIEDRWHVGSASAQDEYSVYVAIETAMAALPEPSLSPAYEARPRALLLTISPEEHDLGLRLVAAALIDRGWDVEVGGGVPSETVPLTLSRYRPDLVGISSTYVAAGTRSELASAVAAVHRAGVPVMVGGSALTRNPSLSEYVGADVVGGHARLAVLQAGRLVQPHPRSETHKPRKAS